MNNTIGLIEDYWKYSNIERLWRSPLLSMLILQIFIELLFVQIPNMNQRNTGFCIFLMTFPLMSIGSVGEHLLENHRNICIICM